MTTTTDFTTCDLYDENESLQSLSLQLTNFGGLARFTGPIRTVKCYRDNGLVKDLLNSPGEGAVLVIDGEGSLDSALMGDLIAAAAVENGWAGVVINGAIRDRVEVGQLQLGVKALGTNPRKSVKDGKGEVDVVVDFGGVTFTPGKRLWSDEDGIVVEP
ncbi:ribonuclease E activity regulator RraA [Nesterenkonia flava]|uniref:4-hydroxy-4-methyl-2-oxoglutarate aldolase n=1 Tax=Nesterenkonia flava TaxID=469799 RepID=A0ABU1FUX7_9MICC|nr:ribonuclease E activity regulator RraA [Nesterenkonia flava]MDR5712476.1 ribonuclease E activity regulator RraA [Nesterenkonia flava]